MCVFRFVFASNEMLAAGRPICLSKRMNVDIQRIDVEIFVYQTCNQTAVLHSKFDAAICDLS